LVSLALLTPRPSRTDSENNEAHERQERAAHAVPKEERAGLADLNRRASFAPPTPDDNRGDEEEDDNCGDEEEDDDAEEEEDQEDLLKEVDTMTDLEEFQKKGVTVSKIGYFHVPHKYVNNTGVSVLVMNIYPPPFLYSKTHAFLRPQKKTNHYDLVILSDVRKDFSDASKHLVGTQILTYLTGSSHQVSLNEQLRSMQGDRRENVLRHVQIIPIDIPLEPDLHKTLTFPQGMAMFPNPNLGGTFTLRVEMRQKKDAFEEGTTVPIADFSTPRAAASNRPKRSGKFNGLSLMANLSPNWVFIVPVFSFACVACLLAQGAYINYYS
jgi:hypothetical protein